MTPELLSALVQPTTGDRAADIANLLLRAAFGTLVFIIHGLHKAAEAIRHWQNLAEWPLAREVKEIGMPAPIANAVFATIVQLIAPLFIIAGFGTRPAAALLAAILSGAVAQNLKARRDPQLAILYLIVAVTLAIWGSGRFSIDAARWKN